MKKLTNLLPLLILTAALAIPAQAQTDTNASASNPFTSVLQSTIVDTNSTFFDSGKLDLRADTQTSIDRYESVLSGAYYPNGDGKFGVGAEIINGAANVVDSAFLTLEYDIPYHNLKVRPFFGGGWDWVNRAIAIEAGGALDVALSKNMFAETAGLLEVPTRNYSGQNISGTFRLGVGWKF